MENTKKVYNRVQTKPVGMAIRPSMEDQYLKETFGVTDEELIQLENGTYKTSSQKTEQTSTKHPTLVAQDQYIKQTFGLNDEELGQLEKGTYKISTTLERLEREEKVKQKEEV